MVESQISRGWEEVGASIKLQASFKDFRQKKQREASESHGRLTCPFSLEQPPTSETSFTQLYSIHVHALTDSKFCGFGDFTRQTRDPLPVAKGGLFARPSVATARDDFSQSGCSQRRSVSLGSCGVTEGAGSGTASTRGGEWGGLLNH